LDQLGTYILGNAGGNIIPLASNTYSIGNSTTWWKDLWLSANTLYIGGVPIGTAGGELTFGGNAVGTSGLDTYTGNVSASNISVGSTTVGNTTTTPTFSVEGSTGNITAGNISAGNITSTGDFGAASVSTPTVSSNTVNCGAGGVNFIQGAVDSVTLTNPGTEKGYNRGFVIYPTGGTGTGFAFVIKETTNPESGSGSISVWEVYNPGQGYTAGDVLTFAGQYLSDPAEFIINAVNDVGTLTAGDSTWSFDPTGDTTIPGNISLPDNTAIYNEDASTAVFTSNIISDATSIYLTDTGNAAVYASDSVVLETNSDGNVAQQWAFNADGSVTFPVGATLRDGNAGQIVFGASAGRVSQGASAIAIGGSAGEYNQGVGATSIGLAAGFNNQGNGTTAVGYNAGRLSQGNAAIAVGFDSGVDSQGQAAIAIGNNSGRKNQKDFSISIGYYAGNTSQGNNSVSIGYGAGYENQKLNAISIGKFAGYNLQGLNAIAIGENAGYNAQANNSIIINATGSELNLTTANAFVVAPVRSDSGNISTAMYYNTTTKEVTYADSYSNVQVNSYLTSEFSGTINGNVGFAGGFGFANVGIPSLANSAGTAGTVTWDSNYIYICTATNTWKRANIATW
jgi:hypothetical protein